MRKIITTMALMSLSSFVLVGCEKKDEGGETSSNQGPGGDEGNDKDKESGKIDIETDPNKKILEALTLTTVMIPEMLPPVAANAPGALAISVGSSLTSFDIDCADVNATCVAGLGADQQLCNLAADIKCRFFADQGPVTIKKILGDLDRDMAEIETLSSGKYVPCLDPVGNKDGLEIQDGDKKKAFLPFEDVAFDTKHTGLKTKAGADHELDIGYTFSLNCMRFLDDSKTKWSAMGFKKNEEGKNVYTVSTMGGIDGDRNGSVGTIDEDDNVVYWGIVSQTGKATLAELNSSNALIHLKSNAAEQTIELNFTGTNVGPGCGTRMVTNKTHALVETNLNMVGDCEADDTSYDAAKDNLTYCMKVDGDNPEFLTVPDCTSAGLTTASFTRERLTSSMILPFEIYKLFSAPQGVPEFAYFDLPKKEEEPAPTAE
jgi:hypothetical protein